ncbi:glycerol-3-phosphate acyltransferase [Clostridia bacterium]|nr:glycerol-3-phosphate acyltransferase [Clostridia bacterium]
MSDFVVTTTVVSAAVILRAICVVAGYFIGCFQTAYIVGKLAAKIDIREHGSKNAGTTNMVRVLGAKYAVIVFALDILKAVLAFTLFSAIFNDAPKFFFWNDFPQGSVAGLYAGLGVVLGHNFPVFLKFRGGKGVASSLAIILCLDLRIAGVIFAVGLIILLTTKYVSLMSLVVLALLPMSMIICGYPNEAVVIGLLLTASAYFMHRKNIIRLARGEENKLSIHSKGSLNK